MSDEANPPVTEEQATPPSPDTMGPQAAPNPAPSEPAQVVTREPAPAQPATPYRPSYVFLALIAVLSLGLDLGTKVWAKTRLERASCLSREPITIIKDYASFIFACNRGGAWGLLQHESEAIRRPFFLGISVLAIAFIVSLYRKLTPQQWALKWGLPLVLGGALGNLINRIQYNYVVDFIDVSYKGHHWPTFNIADVAIVVGVGLMAIDMFTPRKATLLPPVAKTPIAPPAPPAAEPEPKET